MVPLVHHQHGTVEHDSFMLPIIRPACFKFVLPSLRWY